VAGDDGQLLLSIGVKRETLGAPVTAAGLVGFQVDTRQANTQVRIPDGGTVVLGGLREDTDTQIQEGLPWLRKIPVLGWLFKNDNTSSKRRELMVFLTAKVVENPGQAAATPDAVPAIPGAPPAPGPTGQAPAPTPVVSAAVPPAARPEPRIPVGGDH
jgi:type II secretory pathway component GspD/PulD (secretin)